MCPICMQGKLYAFVCPIEPGFILQLKIQWSLDDRKRTLVTLNLRWLVSRPTSPPHPSLGETVREEVERAALK
jgi:hypothetical protein